jgi:large repetitive protein
MAFKKDVSANMLRMNNQIGRSITNESSVIDALLNESLILERLSDNTVVLLQSDGSRKELTPSETANLASALLAVAHQNTNNREIILRLFSIVSARNFVFDSDDKAIFEQANSPIQETEPAQPTDGQSPVAVPNADAPELPPEPIESARRNIPGAGDKAGGDHSQFAANYRPGFIGPAGGHLSGLPDENLKFRDSFRRGLFVVDLNSQSTPLATDIGDRKTADRSDAADFYNSNLGGSYDVGFVGPAINHLVPLLNEEYLLQEVAPRILGGVDRYDDDAVSVSVVPVDVDLEVLEDQVIAGTIFPGGPPSGAIVNNLVITAGPTVGTISLTERGDFTITMPNHFSGMVAFDYSFIDGTGATRTSTIQVVVRPVADAPLASVGVGSFTSDEDTSIALVGLSAELVDRDGSEALTRIAIEGVPIGVRFVDSAGRPLGHDTGNGIWLFAPGEVERLNLVAGTHVSGVFQLTLSVTSTEIVNGSSATTLTPFSVAFTPVADAPEITVGAGLFTGDEDTSVRLVGLSAALVDLDGSELLTSVRIENVPVGARFFDNNGMPAGIDTGNGSWLFTPAELAVLEFSMPPHVSGTYDMRIAATATETANGDAAIHGLPFRVVLSPVTDAPSVAVGMGHFTGNEDTYIALTGLAANPVDRDGSESLQFVRINDVPQGFGFVSSDGTQVGVNEGNGIWSFTPSQLQTLQLVPPHDVHGSFTLSLESVAQETATGQTATSIMPFTVTVNAVADAPLVTVSNAAGEEDTRIALTGLSVNLSDTDGSETITQIRISGVPVGAVFTDALGTTRGVNNNDGTWSFNSAQLSGLYFTAPTHVHGNVILTLEGTSTESSNGSVASTSRLFTVTVDASADAPLVTTNSSTINEDTLTLFGPAITYALVDSDGSETVSRVEITGFPALATVDFLAVGSAIVSVIANGYAITGSSTDIRNTLNSFALQAAPNADAEITLNLSVTTVDADASTASTSTIHSLIIQAVADAPVISGSATANEDTDFAVPITVNLVDTDGSETLTSVTVTQIPAGATLNWDTGLPGLVTGNGTSGYTFTGATGEIQALLASLTMRLTEHSDTDFSLRVTAVATESNPTGGQVHSLNAVTIFDVPVTITAVADAPTVPNSSSRGDEDTFITFGPAITYALVDTDGSEGVTSVILSGFPTGAGTAVNYVVSGAANVDLTAGVYTITGTAADIRATLDSFAVRGGTNSDANISLTVGVTTADTGGVTALTTATHNVIIDAVADAPTGSGSASGNEDTDMPLSITLGQTDTDGSQTITGVTLVVPAGQGSLIYTSQPGATVVVTGDSYEITGSQAAITALLATMSLRPTTHSDVAFDIAVTVQSEESNPTTAGEVAGSPATTSFNIPVTITAVADAPTVPNNSTTGTEDTTIIFGSNIAYTLQDTDGSETITSVAISAIPTDWVLAYTASAAAVVDVTSGVYTITGTSIEIRNTLNSFSLTPPLDADADAVLTVEVVTTDTGGVTATRTATHTVIVDADADTPAIAVGVGAFSGNEDMIVTLAGFSAAITDTDASSGRTISEVLDVVRITGVPDGSNFRDSGGAIVGTPGANVAGFRIWTFTAAQLADLRFEPPSQLSGVISMNLEAVARETSNNDLSIVASLPFTVTYSAVADQPIVVTGTSTGTEDTAINFGTGITYTQADNADGSEKITEVAISGVDLAWTVGFTPTGGASVDTSVPGTYRITGASEAGIRATLNSFTITPPIDTDADTTVQVTVTSTETSGSTATSAAATHTIAVTADADTPTVNVGAGTFNTLEDTRVSLAGFAVGISDTDAAAGRPVSESLSLVRITGVSTQVGTGFFNALTGGALVGTNLGGGVWTFTTAQIAAGLFYQPGTNRAGTYNMTLEATAQESSNLDTAVFSRNFLVTVSGVPDQVVVNPTGGGIYNLNEDTLNSNMGTNFGISLTDNDGSQNLVVVLSGLPTAAGSTVTYTPSAGVTHSLIAGILTLNGPSNLVLATLNTLDLRAPTNSDVNIPVSITATTSENGTTLSDVTGSLTVRVRAIADVPTVSGGVTALEDVSTVVPVTVALPDNDGSESYNFVDIRLSTTTLPAPAGTVLTVVAVGAATAVFNSGTQTWRVTGPTADVEATLLGGVSVRSALNNGANFNIQVSAQSREAAIGAEVVTPTATLAFTNILVTVTDVPDAPSVTVPANVAIEEDTSVTLTGLGITRVDTDGSETFTLTLEGVPEGSSFGGRGTPGSPSGGFQTWTFTQAELTGLTFRPPLHVHGSWSITATSTSRETENGNTAVSTVKNFTITVDAQADAPSISLAGAVGSEDTAIAFGATLANPTTGIALVDKDGSERITSVSISNFPAGVTPTYALVGTGSVVFAGGVYTISGTNEADIRATLATFAMTPLLHSDANIPLTVTASTIDFDGSTAVSAAVIHTVVVEAVADQPTLVTAAASGTEDTAIALSITSNRIDTDGSEVLSVRITLPAGVSSGTISGNIAGGGSITNQGAGVFLIEAPTEAQLDTLLATLTFTPPANWSGTTNLSVEAISTETGAEIATETATRTSLIPITVGPIVDAPALKVIPSIGGAAGYEDTPIRLSIAVTVADSDGSETYVVRLTNKPATAVYTDAFGSPIGVEISPGVWEFTSAQLAILHIIAPFNSNADFILNVETLVTDTGPGGPSVTTLTGTLPVSVIGVADAPTVVTPVVINTPEDQPIPLGANAVASLTDLDGSETLYFVIAGLPPGTVPSRGTYIGGEWQISAADMPFLTIPAPSNFHGNYLSGISVRAVTQEDDGDQAVSDIDITIQITPVVDGFSWSPSTTLNEESSISLAVTAAGINLIDNDGSEQIKSYTFDFNAIIADARIGATVASTAAFINNHISGTFTNNGNGTITVLAGNLSGVTLDATVFRDSNVNFTLPVVARIEEPNGSFMNVASNLAIALDGVADIPTVFANSVSGTAGTIIALNPTGVQFGGVSTDTDIALSRPLSERIYYIVHGLNSNPAVEIAFTNSAGSFVGIDNGDGSWFLEPADLVGLSIISKSGGNGTLNLSLTTVAVENDSGSRAQSSTSAAFTVTVVPGSGGTGPAPLSPVVTISASSGNEDGSITLNVNAVASPLDPTTPNVAVLISNIPLGFTITGATFNTITGRWIASGADINAGNVRLVPPANWSGSLTGVNTVQIEAIATNQFLNRTSTGLIAAPITITPVADGPSISANPAAGIEDQAIALNLNISALDNEVSSPETVVSPIILTIPAGTMLSAGTHVGGNVWHLTPAQITGLTITPPSNYFGPLSVNVEATTRESSGATAVGSATVNLTVAARADIPNATVNDVTAAEDTFVPLTGLSASLVDNDGSEVLSVKISNVPIGAIFSAGGNNGDGTWTIPVAELATLAILPPKDFSGVMNLTLNVFSLETSNGDTSVRSLPFAVTITPVADTVALDPQNMTLAEDQPTMLVLNLAMEDRRGNIPGENAPETVRITFTGLPTGASLSSASATIIDLGGGSWQFTGTMAQANAIFFIPANNYVGVATIGMSAVAIDGASISTMPNVDSMMITVTAAADAPVLQTNPVQGPVSTSLSMNLFAFLSDTNGSETLTVDLMNVPAGAIFSSGTNLGGGAWQFTAAQLQDLTVTLAPGTTDTNISVTATSTEASNGSTAVSNGSIAVTVGTGPSLLTGTSLSDTLIGSANDDTISGLAGSDILIGGQGADILNGGAAADVFRYRLGDNAGGTDQINGFVAGNGGDILDIEALLPGYDGTPSLLANFVSLDESAGNTNLRIDATGTGTFSASLLTLNGVVGLDLATLRANGNLIT